jgi:hypothetical protein
VQQRWRCQSCAWEKAGPGMGVSGCHLQCRTPDGCKNAGCLSCAAEELLAEVAAALAPGEQLGVPPARAQALWFAGHDPSLFTPHVSGAGFRVRSQGSEPMTRAHSVHRR